MFSQLSVNRQKIKNPGIYFMVKRLMDIILSLSSIILLIPLFIIIGILIKRDSKGPVIFKQERYGKHKEPFYIYKFSKLLLFVKNK